MLADQALVALSQNRLDRARQELDEASTLEHSAPTAPRDLYTGCCWVIYPQN